MLSEQALSAEFKSVYRLFLRGTASATPQSTRSTKILRRHWRPIFEEAAMKMTRLNDPNCHAEHAELSTWMRVWDKKLDNILSILYTSSHSHGLANRLTRNLSLLYTNIDSKPTGHWKPQYAPDDPRYRIPEPVQFEKAKVALQRRRGELEKQSWNALGEAIRMAESTNEISLGRIIKNPR
ncbi:hypothetical protein BDY19DRAFT_893492 [Irpex rosettiformis]|uniref:Uncharacterized protein n=1 Tax=Irpex rosettiformis TaxID=378272 RepID=A0ACB8TZF9_9APHY|nr:hypothetical protein BDY19DRAFT_893492 [Irpex rosettiformis]